MDLLGIGERDQAWVDSMHERLFAQSTECADIRIRHRADTIYLLVMGGRVITMQTGFAMLESAYGEKMNAANIMMKNTMDLLIGAISFFFVGNWIAYEQGVQWDSENNFDYAFWFMQFSYATTAATIDSGALAGRVAFNSYVIFSVIVTGVIYPLGVRWTWGGGWLAEEGFMDFAGSAVVHMIGGVSALVSTIMLGPRIGKYPDFRGGSRFWRFIIRDRRPESYYRVPTDEIEKAIFITPRNCSNPVQALFGLFVLIIGFLAFNPASTFSTVGDMDLVSARATVTTLLAGSGGAIGCTVWSLVTKRCLCLSVPDFVTSILGSMVGICAGCNVVTPAVAILVGFIAALLALAMQVTIEKLQIDDPVGAVAVHGVPGVWGALSVAIFAKPHCLNGFTGLVYGGGSDAWEQLGIQCFGILSLAGMTAGLTYLTVLVIGCVLGFRCERSEELIGLDYVEHDFDDGTYTADANKIAFLSNSPVKRYEFRMPSGGHQNDTKSPSDSAPTRKQGREPKDIDYSIQQSDQTLRQQVAELKRTVREITDGMRKMRDEMERPQQRVAAILQLLEREHGRHEHDSSHNQGGHPHAGLHAILDGVLEHAHNTHPSNVARNSGATTSNSHDRGDASSQDMPPKDVSHL